MEKSSKIFIAGHSGLVGSALLRKLKTAGYMNILTRTHSGLDLTQQSDVSDFFESELPDYVVLAAAKVGGILANNTYPAQFIYDNLAIQTHVIHAAWKTNVRRLLFLGSSCIYPKNCPQPIKEEYLLNGPLETTNEPYAVAKISGIKMCQSYNRQYGTKFFAVMPTNLYGPNDNFDLKTSHVLPALIRKFHEAKFNGVSKVEVWGSGKARREFLHVDDLADACLYILNLEKKTFNALLCEQQAPIVNIGVGKDISILELTELIKQVIDFKGKTIFDPAKPDGTPRKLLDVFKLAGLGWQPEISLENGIRQTYKWFSNLSSA